MNIETNETSDNLIFCHVYSVSGFKQVFLRASKTPYRLSKKHDFQRFNMTVFDKRCKETIKCKAVYRYGISQFIVEGDITRITHERSTN